MQMANIILDIVGICADLCLIILLIINMRRKDD